jgi:hypothetical protein
MKRPLCNMQGGFFILPEIDLNLVYEERRIPVCLRSI